MTGESITLTSKNIMAENELKKLALISVSDKSNLTKLSKGLADKIMKLLQQAILLKN